MVPFADISLEPGSLVAWMVVGLLAGCLSGSALRGGQYGLGGYGALADVAVGLPGAVLGGFLFGLLVGGSAGFWGGLVAAFLASCAFIALVRLVVARWTRP